MTDIERSSPSSDPPPGEDADTEPIPGETYVVFSVDTHGYALPVETVHHVLPMPPVTRIPTEAGHVLGVFHHAGKVLPLWDLHTLFGAEGPPPERPGVLVFAIEGHPVGLLVERVDEVVTVEESELAPSEEESLSDHVTDIIAGWLRVPEDDPDGEEEVDSGPSGPEALNARLRAVAEDSDAPVPTGLETMLAATGRPDRGVAVLALLAPVHLLHPHRLFALGSGRRIHEQEVRDGRS